MKNIKLFEWTGSIFGLAGALLLAVNTNVSPFGWLAFFIANLAMIVFAYRVSAYGLLVQQIGYTGTTLVGIYQSNLIFLLL